MAKVKAIKARQIIDSRATPTVEVDVFLEDGSMGRAAVPSGASTGIHEALELRDGDTSHFLGKSVGKAIENVNNLASEIFLTDFHSQEQLDRWLINKDGTENKSKLGANAILAISLAYAHAVALSQKVPLYQYISSIYGGARSKMPRPMFNIMNGGRHANWATDIQEFMIIIPNKTYFEQLETASEIFMNLGKLLEKSGLNTNVGNEGGYAPGFKTNEEAFEYVMRATENAGFKMGEEVYFGLDIAASEFFNQEKNSYDLKTEGTSLTIDEWNSKLESWLNKYPLLSIEDPYGQDDWGNWSHFTAKYSQRLQIVGDDLLVTNTNRIKKGIELKACNALLVKPNQIGTLTETIEAMKMASQSGWGNIVSHRSGETEDISIAHIAVGTGCGQIKTGAPSRGERTAKYNELLRIEEMLKF